MGGTCLAFRKARNLSRSDAYDIHGVSQSYLYDIEHDKRIPTPATLDRLIDAYDLDSRQSQYLHELRQPAQDLPGLDQLAHRLRGHPGLMHHLEHLTAGDVLGAYVDPLHHILACNDLFRTAWPGLGETDSILSWIFGEAAAPSAPDRTREATKTVAITRMLTGRYRTSTQTNTLLHQLSDHGEFTRRWRSSIDVADGRSPDDLLYRRHPDTGDPLSFAMTMSKVHIIDHVWLLTLLPIPRSGPANT
ncbi:MmyB family transcriptional regulator [Nocardia sputi]|uniref:MmyB family transcriptional regulator n=1 Tax=Nocardia sputi TaxID=2943705 RepID=UPI0020BD9D39|nr:helix-turn-helix domain-containing protein [Nocardia sputi]